MRPLAGVLALALVALPVMAVPVPVVAGLGTAAGLLCLAGIVWRSLRLVTAGAAGAVIQYALGLWLSSAPPDLFTAVALGVVLALLLEVIEFAARVHGMAVDRLVLQRQVRDWVGSAAISGAAGLALAVGAARVTLGLPAWACAGAAGLSAFAAFGGIVRVLLGAHGRAHEEGPEPTQ